MREISLEESKKLQLDLLSAFAEYCDKKGLRYYLAYGTLLGAIRHKGFIPWDDDTDVHMPREDYNKLMDSFNEGNEDSPYFLVRPETKLAQQPHAKIIDTRTEKREFFQRKGTLMGVDIDVFPLDGMPADDAEYKKWFNKLMKVYRSLIYASRGTMKGKPYANVKVIIGRMLHPSRTRLLKKAAKLHALYPYDQCEYIGGLECTFEHLGTRNRKACYEDYVMVEFEGKQFKAPKEYHEVLTNYYGDYMTPPPKEKQATHHLNNCYYKD